MAATTSAFSSLEELPLASFTLLMKALMRGLELGGALPWDEVRINIFPAGSDKAFTLAYASALQRALARALIENWAPGFLSEHLRIGGLSVACAESAASAWAAGGALVAEAVARRKDTMRPILTHPPRFVAVTGGASSASGGGERQGEGEARAVISLGDGCEFEATKKDLIVALAAIAQLKKAFLQVSV